MIRDAVEQDIPQLLKIGEKFHSLGQLPCKFDHAAMQDLFLRLMNDENSCLFISEGGTIGGLLSPYYCDPKWVMAVELFWWSEDRNGLKLLSRFEEWSEEKKAKEVRMTSMDIYPRAGEILGKLGYRAAEISHTKVI